MRKMMRLSSVHRLIALAWLASAVQHTSSEGIKLPDVHRMVRNLGTVYLEQSCTVVGADDGPECASFNRSEYRTPNKVITELSDENNPKRLYYLREVQPFQLIDEWMTGSGTNAKNLPKLFQGGGMRKPFDQQRELIEDLVERLEQIYFDFVSVDPNFSPATLYNETNAGPQQANWRADYAPDGLFQGRYISQTQCAFHKPTTEKLDSLHVDADILRIKDTCGVMMGNLDKYKDIGLTFQYASTINGVTMDYPASLRGLGFDNRYETWFKKSLWPPKDVVIVVDHSGSMEASAPCGALKLAEAQVKSILRSFITEQDRVQLMLIGDDPQLSPCFGTTLVPGNEDNLQTLLDWFFDASRERGGAGTLGAGVMEALNILRDATDSGLSTGGAKFVIVMTDGLEVEDIVEQGIRRHAAQAGSKTPLTGLHMVGVALAHPGQNVKAATPLDAAACAQRGVVWKLMLAQDSMDRQGCRLREVNVSIDDGQLSFEADPALLLNATDLVALAAFPFSLPPEDGGLPSMYWHNIRADIKVANKTGFRTIVSAGKPFFDKRASPPKAAGVATADFLMNDFAHALRSIDVPALTHISVIKHQGDIGHVLEHTSTPPDYSDYVSAKAKRGDFNSKITEFEGPIFEAAGVLNALVQEDEGSRTVERRMIVDQDWSPMRDANLMHLVREDVSIVTYFWKRIPGTSFTVLVSVVGAPTEQGGSTMLTPSLMPPVACPREDDASLLNRRSVADDDDTCWSSTYSEFPSVYHRLDLMGQLGLPARVEGSFGGASACCCAWCTYDTSTWLATSSSFLSDRSYTQFEQTYQQLASLNLELAGSRADESMLGGGLREQAMYALKVTSNMEPFWKSVLGVEGTDTNGNAKVLNSDKTQARRDILQVFFATDTGILRTFPGLMAPVPVDYNVRREPYFTRAVSHPGEMAVSQPYLPDAINTSSWVITLSKAIYHAPIKKERGLRNHAFGVAGVHMRFDAFVRLFRRATTLRDTLKFGCGDMGTSDLADRGLACFLLNENANILLDRKMMSLSQQHPDSLAFQPAMRDLHAEEPFLMHLLLQVNAISQEVLRYGTTQHVAYRINHEALEQFSARKRAAAADAGLPQSDLVGMEQLKRIKTPNGFTRNEIWLYQVPMSKTYLLVVTGYEPLTHKYMCGQLSLFCPSVFDPLESTILTSVCNRSLETAQPKKSDYVYAGPTFQQLRQLHRFNAIPAAYNLQCPLTFQIWTIGALVVGTLLLLGVVYLLTDLLLRRARRRRAAERVSQNVGKGTSYMEVKEQEELKAQQLAGSAQHAVQGARLKDYQLLVARQWQLAENLSKRDEGDMRGLSMEIQGLTSGTHELFQQLDYLQHRVQKQEVLGPNYKKLRRNGENLSYFTRDMLNQVDGLKADGHLPGLDPDLEEDATQLRTSLAGEALPQGTRETLFHRINFPHLVEHKSLRSEYAMDRERQKVRGNGTIVSESHTDELLPSMFDTNANGSSHRK